MYFNDLLSVLCWRITKWNSIKEEFANLTFDDILQNLEACFQCCLSGVRKMEIWCPPLSGSLKFTLDGAARGKSNLAKYWRSVWQ